MQTPARQPFAFFGQYADKEVQLDLNMCVQLGFPTGGGLYPYSFRRLDPQVDYIGDDIPRLHELINNDRVTIRGQPWGDGKIYQLMVTPEEYVILHGQDFLKKDVKQRYIGCIASVQVNYPNEPDRTTYYTIIPFRPLHAHETELEAWNDKEITINWGGIISMNSEHAV